MAPRWWRLRLQPFGDDKKLFTVERDGEWDEASDTMIGQTHTRYGFDDDGDGELTDVIATELCTTLNRVFLDVLRVKRPSLLWMPLTEPGEMTHPDRALALRPAGGLYQRTGW